MANETDKLGILLEANSGGSGFQEFRDELKETEQAGTESAKKIEEGYEEAFTSIRNASAVAFAAVGAAIGFSVKEAAAAERGMISYRGAVRNAGGDADYFGGQIEEVAMKLQRLTGIADDDFITTAARMTDITGDAAGSLDNLGLVADFAAARSIDVASAGDMVAKAMLGEVGMLGRLLPGLQEEITALGETSTEGERASIIFDRLAVFQGRAAETANSAAGSFNIMKEEISATTESIGNAFLPALRDITSELTPIIRGIGEFAQANQGLVQVLGIGALAVTGFTLATSLLFLGYARVVSTAAMAGTAISAVTGLVTFQTTALWGNSIAWNAVGLAIYAIPGWGWALAGVSALVALTIAVSDFETEVEDTPVKVQNLEDAFDGLTPAVSDATSVVRDFSKVTAEELEAALRENAIPGISDFGDKVDDVAEKIAGLAATQLSPLNLQVNETIGSDSTGGFDFAAQNEAQLQGQIYLYEQTQEQRTADEQRQLASWEHQRNAFLEHTAFLQSSYRFAVGTFADADMTGKERREAIWNQFRGSVINMIGDVTAKYIFGELAKRSASVATATVGLAASTTATTIEVANSQRVAAGWMAAAYAKLVGFYGWAGPLAPVLAAGTIAAAIAGIGAVVASAFGAMKFAEGGVVPGSGSGDTVPALLTPGEGVLTKRAMQQNPGAMEAMNAGRGYSGGGNTYVLQFGENTSAGDMFRIRQLVEDILVPTIERKQREGAFTMAGVPA